MSGKVKRTVTVELELAPLDMAPGEDPAEWVRALSLGEVLAHGSVVYDETLTQVEDSDAGAA